MLDPKTDPRLNLPPSGEALPMQVTAGVTALRKTPEPDGEMVSQALHGETVILHHEEGEFGLVQNQSDRYVGWALMEALSAPIIVQTHRVQVPRLHVYAEPSIRAAPHFVIGIGARLVSTGARDGRYLKCERAGWVREDLLCPIDDLESDPAGVAERYVTTPYLWGGRDCLGLDCSGLIQIAFDACDIAVPRDSDMQFEWVGAPVENWSERNALRRNDLIFWDGHVGIMLDSETLLHANANHMATAAEPLSEAIERIAKLYGEPIGARRINLSESVGVKPNWLDA
ncbi:MAG: NlpC/P60 family protein [Pseudomonadota bacterium]